ncbi:hypothetical protein Pint_20684 [Pistacia integerrima]|uniref:Uncharacterized protein n=1 Tax=Pistacia integerrima TaxID=434235 RepID=A0ACC0XDI4_9ROSI|nr:hypothetical protein Pint_20684 [Pistacia integerrima]
MATFSSDSVPIAINATRQITAHLTLTNFPSWHAQFESLLLGYNLFGYVDGAHTCLPLPTSTDVVATAAHHLWITKYLHSVKTIADELALIDAPLSQANITLFPTYNFTLNMMVLMRLLLEMDQDRRTREILLQGPCEHGVYPLPSSPAATPVPIQSPTDSSTPEISSYSGPILQLASRELPEIRRPQGDLPFASSTLSEDPALVQPPEAPIYNPYQVPPISSTTPLSTYVT